MTHLIGLDKDNKSNVDDVHQICRPHIDKGALRLTAALSW